MRIQATSVLLAAALAAVTLGGGGARAAEAPDADLRARYEVPGSRYLTIDGVRIHYVDRGKGPAIVLLHGSYASLRQWSGWADVLERHYRVIRFDMPPAGLSDAVAGADTGVAHKVALVDAVTRRLHVARFVLVATSSGGYAAAAFAAEHGARLTGLVLNNTAYGKLGGGTENFPPALAAAIADDATHPRYHLPEYWRQVLRYNFADPDKVTPALVEEWTDLNNRARALPPTPPPAPIERTPGDLARVTVPTLLLWSADDQETTLAREARQSLAGLAARDKTLVVIPRCGHIMPSECGAEGLALAMPFLERVTRGVR